MTGEIKRMNNWGKERNLKSLKTLKILVSILRNKLAINILI